MIKVLQQLQRGAALTLALLMVMPFPAFAGGQQSGSGSDTGFVLKAESDLVLTNVVVRDAKTGEVVRGLKQSDFTIMENGKAQRISSFDFESVDMAQPLNEATISGIATSLQKSSPGVTTRPEDLRNHRLIVFFFDLTSMQPEDLDRCVEAAKDFLNNKLQPADLVALVSLA
jgi:VWFA-related protein